MDGCKKEFVYELQELDSVVQELKKLMATYQVFAITGPLGAGKTTTIKALLRSCGITVPVTSPTFTYVNEYDGLHGEKFYHFDCYRIATIDQFILAGFNELLYQPCSWTFIEWPEVIAPLLTRNICHITIDYNGEHERILHLKIPTL